MQGEIVNFVETAMFDKLLFTVKFCFYLTACEETKLDSDIGWGECENLMRERKITAATSPKQEGCSARACKWL